MPTLLIDAGVRNWRGWLVGADFGSLVNPVEAGCNPVPSRAAVQVVQLGLGTRTSEPVVR